MRRSKLKFHLRRLALPVVAMAMVFGFVQAVPASAATSLCTGAPATLALTDVHQYAFNEAAGSTVFKDSVTGLDKYSYKVVPGYTNVTANGGTVTFNDASPGGMIATDGNVFSPGTHDFAVCILVKLNDSEYNLWQTGNSKTPPTVYGMVKATGPYAQFIATDQGFKILQPNGGTQLNGAWHWITLYRQGNVFGSSLDGATPITKVKNDIGPIDLNQRSVLGGKLSGPGNITAASDLCNCSVAALYFGVAR